MQHFITFMHYLRSRRKLNVFYSSVKTSLATAAAGEDKAEHIQPLPLRTAAVARVLVSKQSG